MKQFFKHSTLAIGLVFGLTTYALPNNTLSNQNNPVSPNTPITQNNLAQKQQAGNTQNATNSLILWLNNNLVNGTPLQFAQTMKGNWGSILSNESLSTLTWELTRGITFVDLKGTTPESGTTNDNSNSNNKKTALAQKETNSNNVDVSNRVLKSGVSANGIDTSIGLLNVANQAKLVPDSTTPDQIVTQKLSQFNIGKLLSTNTIAPKSEDDKNAQILMQFISGLATSVSPLTTQQINNNTGPINLFQPLYGVYVAQQSLGLNILYSLISERLVQKGLGTQLGGPQADMSPLAIDQYMATRRLNVNDPNGWLAQLSTAKPAVVMKEELMMLAEIRYELYETRRVLVNIEQLMAVQELQSNEAKADQLNKLQASIAGANQPNAINQ